MSMKGYKAFESGLVCRGKQYEENTIFEESEARICRSGMHFCKNPLDVLDYYPLVDNNGKMTEFAEVEALDECYTDDNKKYCTKKLKIGAKLNFPALVQASVSLEFEIDGKKLKVKKSDADDEKISSKADYAQIGSSGYSAQIGSSGDYAKIGSSGDSAKIGSSGDSAKIGSSGDYAQIGSSGDYAKIGSSGYSAQIGSSGYSAKIGSIGLDSVICCAGHNSIVKAKKGSWITLSEWKYDNAKGRGVPICVKTEFVDGERIKSDTWYKLVNGKFVEVNE